MSCRILGRGVEQAVLALDEARRRRCVEVSGEFLPTPKNQLAAGVYPQFGFVAVRDGQYRLAVADAQIAFPEFLRLAAIHD
jgi:predicted enzyme involved in methoxymalonyl-ACP biosynthesis